MIEVKLQALNETEVEYDGDIGVWLVIGHPEYDGSPQLELFCETDDMERFALAQRVNDEFKHI